MSVGRLAEPPKPSFLLLGEVSQSHPFMCNACKSMHSDTTAQQRDMEGQEWAAIKMGQSRTSTTGQQQYSKYQYPTTTSAAGATGGLQTLRRAEEQHGELLVTGSARG